MNILQLLWIVPLSAILGFAFACILTVSAEREYVLKEDYDELNRKYKTLKEDMIKSGMILQSWEDGKNESNVNEH